ncbi:MAG: hypothetical protein JW910_18270, partial [Anaerolineae bacterium]|nr:hypothetical protein [Anaerolineae bacterium]
MRQWLKALYRLETYSGALARSRAITLYIVTSTLLLIAFVMFLALMVVASAGDADRLLPLLVGNLIVQGVLVAIWLLLRRGRFLAARNILLVMVFPVVYVPMLGSGWTNISEVMLMVTLLTLVTLLAEPRSVIVATLVSILGLVAVMLSARDVMDSRAFFRDLASGITILAAAGGLNYLLGRGWQQGVTTLE